MDKLGPYPLDSIITGDARILAKEIPDESVDLIFTDPPYDQTGIPFYGWLAKESARLLKPSGFLLTYAGGFWKDQIMDLMRPHLDFFWDFIEICGSNSSIVWQRKVIARCKSILAYRKKGSSAMPQTNVLALIPGHRMSKEWHPWGQCEETAHYLISCFTSSGNLVVDFFGGGGTTKAACEALNRPYLLFEIDPDVVEKASNRMAQFQPSLPALRLDTIDVQLLAELEAADA